MKKPNTILTIETLEKFERVINRETKPYDINMMVMPGTLEDKHKNCESIPALRRQFNLLYLFVSGEHDVKLGAEQTQLRSNDLVIVPENNLYASDHIKNCKGFCIHFKTEFIQPLLSNSIYEEFSFFNFDSERIINLNEVESNLIQQSFRDIITEHERFSSEKIASERGIFELKALDSSGKELWKSYGKFHVFMRKLNGVWKIVVDYDSNEKNTIDEKAYLAAFVMDDFEKY